MTRREVLSPEERLLKVIENPALRTHDASWRGTALVFFRKLRGGDESLSIQMLVRVVEALCILTVFVGAIHFVVEGYVFKGRFDRLYEKKAITPSASPSNAELVADDPKLKELTRNVFGDSTGASAAETKPKSVPANNELKLVGVLWSDHPQAMLEDKSGRTFLVNEGDAVADVTIKKIYQDRAIATNGHEDWELR